MLVGVAVFAAGDSALAADVYWQGAGTGGNTANLPANISTHWNTSSNWQSGLLPGSLDHAVLDFDNTGVVFSDEYDVGNVSVLGTGDAYLSLVSGNWSIDRVLQIRETGQVVQQGGTHSIGHETIISGVAGTDAYRLEGGELDNSRVLVGVGGFTQTGGLHKAVFASVTSPLSTGGYTLHDGELNATDLQVNGGTTIDAGFRQVGGHVTVSEKFSLAPFNRGRFEMAGGTMDAQRLEFGASGKAEIVQTGGDLVATDALTLATASGSAAAYQLSAGTITTKDMSLAGSGAASFTQLGGRVQVTNRLTINGGSGTSNRYELVAGELTAGEIRLGSGGSSKRIVQQGGALQTGVLAISTSGTYEWRGGSLQTTAGLSVRGVMDFAGTNAGLNLGPNQIVDLTGQIQNASNASFHVGADSLTILRVGFNPATTFANYSNAGHVMTTGTRYVLPAGATIRGGGEIQELLEVRGRLEPNVGYLLDVYGVYVAGNGVVDLGAGQALLNRPEAGIEGGLLRARRMTITTSFSQSGGASEIAEDVRVNGTLNVSGGALNALDMTSYGFVAQTGGQVYIADWLQIFGNNYSLSAGTLTTSKTGIWNSSRFNQTGGVHRTKLLTTITRGVYAMTGGELVADEIDVGGDASGELTISENARVFVTNELRFGEGGTLTITGGTIRARQFTTSNQFSNRIVWQGGRLELQAVAGSPLVNNGGVLAPTNVADDNATGLLQIATDYQQLAGSVEIQLASASSFDRIEVSGAMTLAGKLKVALLDGFVPQPWTSYSILLAAGGISGNFQSLELPNLGPSATWQIVRTTNTISVSLALVGDFNRDGFVDAADFPVWRDTLGRAGSGLAADANGDAKVSTLR